MKEAGLELQMEGQVGFTKNHEVDNVNVGKTFHDSLKCKLHDPSNSVGIVGCFTLIPQNCTFTWQVRKKDRLSERWEQPTQCLPLICEQADGLAQVRLWESGATTVR